MYKSPRERFDIRVYADKYTVYCQAHLIYGGGVADLLNTEKGYLPVTDAKLYLPGHKHPPQAGDLKGEAGFLALQKNSLLWLAGGRPSSSRAGGVVLERRKVIFLYGPYALTGLLETPKGARLSDYVSTAKTFQTVFDAGLYELEARKPITELSPLEGFEFVTVNLHRVEGIVEIVPGEQHDTIMGAG